MSNGEATEGHGGAGLEAGLGRAGRDGEVEEETEVKQLRVPEHHVVRLLRAVG